MIGRADVKVLVEDANDLTCHLIRNRLPIDLGSQEVKILHEGHIIKIRREAKPITVALNGTDFSESSRLVDDEEHILLRIELVLEPGLNGYGVTLGAGVGVCWVFVILDVELDHHFCSYHVPGIFAHFECAL